MDTASKGDCRCVKVFVQPRPSSIGAALSQCQEVFLPSTSSNSSSARRPGPVATICLQKSYRVRQSLVIGLVLASRREAVIGAGHQGMPVKVPRGQQEGAAGSILASVSPPF